MGEKTEKRYGASVWFWALLLVAVVVRALQFDPYAAHHPDEVLQYIEPAYRLLTGDGIVTWEYRYGMRGWLLPVLLSVPMSLGQFVGGTAFSGVVAARLAAAAVCLLPVISAWHLGRRLSLTHGIVAMAAMAVWYEQVVFSTHLLTESISTSLFFGAVALMSGPKERKEVIVAGALLALTVALRFHYAVAVGVFVILAFGRDWTRWIWAFLGSLPVLIGSAVVDMAMGQWPYQWMWTNVLLNVIEGRSARFGVETPIYLLEAMWTQWSWLAVPIAGLALIGGRHFRPLLFAAVFNLAVHSVIAHKEYRFVELTSASFILLAAVGSVDLARRFKSPVRFDRPVAVLLVIGWALASAWLGRDRPLDRGFGERFAGLRLAHVAGQDPKVCGLGSMMVEYWQLSRAYIGRPVPIVLLRNTPKPNPRLLRPGAELASVNAVIAPTESEALLPGYSMVECRTKEPFRRCLYVRPGPCIETPQARDREIQRVLRIVDM